MIFEFEGLSEANEPSKATRKERDWVALGVEWSKAKRAGKTAKEFAELKNIPYATFTKSMSCYASRIQTALKLELINKKSPKRLSKEEKALKLINDFRSSLRDKVKDKGAAGNNKSMKWFTDTIRTSVRTHQVSKPVVGRIYTYAYDAKYKDSLPYWDKFPLMIYLGSKTSKAGNQLLYGLNLHYIPPKARQSFLEELLKNYSNTERITNKTTLKINWSKVKGMRGTDLMIKAYLPGHIKGSMAEVKPADWANIVMLPLQQFMSKGKRYGATKVWSQY